MTSDFADLISALNAEGVEYLIVGGYAVIEYSEPRFTKDLDVWVAANAENSARVYRALARFGAPMDDLSPRDISEPDCIVQIGVSPVRVDILTSITGVDFPSAYGRRGTADFLGSPAPIISREDLILNTRAVGRPRDRADVRLLQRRGWA